MTEHKEEWPKDEWHELDQASVRKSLQDIIRDMPGDYGDLRFALKQLLTITSEEIADALVGDLNRFMEYHPKKSLQDARSLVEEVERDLAGLGLVIQHPITKEPARLTVAATPPTKDTQGWIQVEALNSASKTPPMRLGDVLPRLDIMPEPPRPTLPNRPRSR